MKRVLMAVVVLGIAGVLLTVGIAGAETRYLKQEDVKSTMQGISQALGVQCSYCHLPNGGQDKEAEIHLTPEAQTETRIHFRVARAMLVMTNYANKKGGDPATCNTCHQGKAQPGSK